jgi:hypothetical protein
MEPQYFASAAEFRAALSPMRHFFSDLVVGFISAPAV